MNRPSPAYDDRRAAEIRRVKDSIRKDRIRRNLAVSKLPRTTVVILSLTVNSCQRGLPRRQLRDLEFFNSGCEVYLTSATSAVVRVTSSCDFQLLMMDVLDIIGLDDVKIK